ncbi:hypothetical protein J4408_03255 [Candidatus Pacearchaeota archaeon]|nr:hypothetical protein [Candidatus Pacearchaeota archaeon]
MKTKAITIKKTRNKIRVNISVDKELLDKARGKLQLFGGKLSTLFNAYLSDFVSSIDKNYNENQKFVNEKLKELEEKIKKIEKDKKT